MILDRHIRDGFFLIAGCFGLGVFVVGTCSIVIAFVIGAH